MGNIKSHVIPHTGSYFQGLTQTATALSFLSLSVKLGHKRRRTICICSRNARLLNMHHLSVLDNITKSLPDPEPS